ncbi:DUF3618 domain-containing protein [Varibaculum vaginae]|uniref:DUF3618 domain-containing protein n=1 Tax=Varibaculum vaginae TaxID=2364797 RepID=UPI000F09748A|nr:DUF3618 domain-containing protein [Varibaculum vaginae]
MTPRSESQIKADLEAARADLSDTVEELSDYFSPKANVERAKADAQQKARAFADRAQNTVEQASAGKPEAIKKVAAVAGGALLLGALIVRRILK